MKDKVEFKGKNIVGAFMNVPIFVRKFSIGQILQLLKTWILTVMKKWVKSLLEDRFVKKHVSKQTGLMNDEELAKKEVKQMEADDQAIQTILKGLSKDIYAAVDSCKTAQEIWLHVQQMMKGSDIGIQEKKANLHNRQIAQPGMNLGKDRHMQMVGGNDRNQFRQYARQNIRNQNRYNIKQNVRNQGITNSNANQNGNGNVVATWAEGNGNRNNKHQIRCYNFRGLGHYARNCTAKPRKKDQASTSGTQSNKAPVYDSYGSAEVHEYDNFYNNEIFNMFTKEEQYSELLEPISEPHQVQHNGSNVIFAVSSMEQRGGILEQNLATVEKNETLQLAQESRLKMKQLNKEIEPTNYAKINQLSEVFVSQKAKSREELYFSNTSKMASVSKSISIPNEEFLDDTSPSVARKFLNEVPPKAVESNDLSNPVTSNSVPITKESRGMKNDNVITLGMFRIILTMNSRVDNFMPNKHLKESVRIKPITVSQPNVITKKDMNSNTNGLPSTGVESTTKTSRPHPRSNPKNDRIPSAAKSSCVSNNLEKVEEHHKNLQFSKTPNHRSSKGNKINLAI
uniref:Uncharacterized protein n=1 Tax=Tanacetum cinerariifolium TaxID=118510 RepID=A0A6L2KI37_TANCI|nr:hypothetical protein [Tanacetum cinerariifolium]